MSSPGYLLELLIVSALTLSSVTHLEWTFCLPFEVEVTLVSAWPSALPRRTGDRGQGWLRLHPGFGCAGLCGSACPHVTA